MHSRPNVSDCSGYAPGGASSFSSSQPPRKKVCTSSNSNIRDTVCASGSGASSASTYRGPGIDPSRVSETPKFSGSDALAPRGKEPKFEQNIRVGQVSQKKIVHPSFVDAPTSFSPNAKPYVHPSFAPQGGNVFPDHPLQPESDSMPSPYAPHPRFHQSMNSYPGASRPSNPLQPDPDAVLSPYEAAFESSRQPAFRPYDPPHQDGNHPHAHSTGSKTGEW